MSRYFFERARRMHLKIPEQIPTSFIENMVGVIGSVSCDRIIENMSDKEFIEFVKKVLEEWRKRKQKIKEIEAIA
jgi:hypothetical protein